MLVLVVEKVYRVPNNLLNLKGDNKVIMDNKIKLTDGFIDLMINENLIKFRNKYKNEYALIRETKNLLECMQHKFIDQDVPINEMYIAFIPGIYRFF